MEVCILGHCSDMWYVGCGRTTNMSYVARARMCWRWCGRPRRAGILPAAKYGFGGSHPAPSSALHNATLAPESADVWCSVVSRAYVHGDLSAPIITQVQLGGRRGALCLLPCNMQVGLFATTRCPILCVAKRHPSRRNASPPNVRQHCGCGF